MAVVGLWVLIGLSNWHELAMGVRVGFPKTDNYYGQHLLFDGPVQAYPVIGALVLHACAALLGYVLVVQPIWGRRRLASEIWLLLAGIIPGSLILIAASRVVSLLLDNRYAPGLLMVLILAAGAAAAVAARQRWDRDSVRGASGIWPAICLIACIFLFTIQMDRFHILGEASSWFISDVYMSGTTGIGTAGRFPLISQHYDEAAFLYPVIYGLVHRGPGTQDTLSVLYWIMVSLGRAGVGSLIYLALRSLGVDRLSAVISLGFVCAATLSINAISSRLLFDSLSPLAYALHIARFLIPVLPFLLVAAIVELRGRGGAVVLAVSGILGVGLSAMPVHVAVALAWALPVAALIQVSGRLSNSRKIWSAASIAASMILMGFIVAYAFAHRLPAVICVLILLGAGAVAALIVLGAWWTHAAKDWRALLSMPVLVILAMCAGYAAGLIFLGNILIPRSFAFLGHIWPWSGLEIANRAIGDLGSSTGKLELSPYCSGYYWEFRTLAGHCSSLPMLVRTYGLAFAAMAGIIAWWLRVWPGNEPESERRHMAILCGLVACLLAMPVSFVAYDFVAPVSAPLEWQQQLSIWLRSRLVEPWFCGGLLLALAFFLREASSRARRYVQSAMLGAIAVGGLAPLVIPGQLIVNLSFLFQALLPR
jgi:hypothetical protein